VSSSSQGGPHETRSADHQGEGHSNKSPRGEADPLRYPLIESGTLLDYPQIE
jgi:hypothetical protein